MGFLDVVAEFAAKPLSVGEVVRYQFLGPRRGQSVTLCVAAERVFHAMAADESMALAEEFMAAFNAHDLNWVGRLLSETFLVVSPTGPVGPHGWKRTAAEYIEAFPDTRWVKVQLAGDEEGFALQIIWEGTQQMPPTHRKLRLPVSFRARVLKGKIETLRIDYDPRVIQEQLGSRAGSSLSSAGSAVSPAVAGAWEPRRGHGASKGAGVDVEPAPDSEE